MDTLRTNRHRMFFLFALSLYLCGIPFCRPLMSFGLVLVSANWLAEGKWKEKWETMRHQPLLWVVGLLYLTHVAGLLYTENWDYARQDLLIKLPLIVVPLIFATTTPLSAKEWRTLLFIYLFAVCFSAMYGLIHFQLHDELTDKRFLAVHISYIRFELNLCFALFVSIYLWKHRPNRCLGWLCVAAALWLCAIMIYIGAITAIALTIGCILVTLPVWAIRQKTWYIRWLIPTTLGMGCVVGLLLFLFHVRQYTHTDFDFATADSFTANGHPYCDTLETQQIENGMYLYAYLCDEELEQAWNARSELDYRHYEEENGFFIRNSLIRYLNSRGLRKDSMGLSQLSDEEVAQIEQGVSNVHYLSDNGFKVRFYENLWEIIGYLRCKQGLGSVPQRFEAWEASLYAIRTHPWFGVGTGDVKDAFLQALQETDSPIEGILVRSHNQYISFCMAFGVIGLLVILFSLLYPPFATKRKSMLYGIFLLIVLVSMLADDPLERQDGVSLFAVFNSLFLFLFPRGKD